MQTNPTDEQKKTINGQIICGINPVGEEKSMVVRICQRVEQAYLV